MSDKKTEFFDGSPALKKEAPIAQSFFAEMIDRVPTPVNYISTDYVFRQVNQAYADWLNLAIEDIIDKKVADVIGEEAFAAIREYMDLAFAGEVIHFETEVKYPNQTRFVEAIYTPHTDESGNVRGYVAYLNDITEKKLIEQNLHKKQKELRSHETLYSSLVQSIPLGMYTCDKDGRITFFNELAVTLWGYTPDINDENLRYCACYKVWMPDGSYVPPEKTPMAEVLRSGIPVHNIEAIVGRPDGSTFFSSVNINPFFDDHGNISGAINIFQDISDFKNSETALKSSETKYRKLIANLPVAIYTCDASGYITLYNDAALALWGYHPEVGKDKWHGSWKIYHHDGTPLKADECPMAIALKEKRIIKDAEIIIERPDGVRFNVIPHPQLLFDEQGNVTGAIDTLLDITDVRISEKAVRESEERLRLAAQSASLGSWDLDIATLNVVVSKEILDIFGAEDPDGWTRDKYLSFIKPGDEHIANAAFTDALNVGHLQYELRILRKKEERWIRVFGKTLYNSRNEPVRMLGTVIDVTDQKSALIRLQESEIRFRTVADNAPVMIWMSKADGEFNFINKGWVEFTGNTFKEELGEHWMKNLHPEDKQQCLPHYAQAHEERKHFYIEFRLKRHDGEYRWLACNGVPRYSDAGGFLGFIGSCIDITEKKSLDQQKDEFLGIVSHELKTPLTSLKAYAQIIRASLNNQQSKDREIAERMETQIDKLNLLVKDISDVTRIENGKLQFRKELFAIDQFVMEICGEVQHVARQHRIVIVENVQATVYTDKERMGQILINLLTNAIKYSPSADKVMIAVAIEEEQLVCRVRDFGIGISPDITQKIFERFYREPDLNMHEFAGLGLGLYISSGIVNRMGGKIWVESELGKGSVFIFSIPMQKLSISGM